MKRSFFASVIVTAVLAPACVVIGGPCEYRSFETTARVSVTTLFPYEWDCIDPVEVKLLWGQGAGEWTLTPYAGKNLPRACLDEVGLSAGAEVNILVKEEIKGSCAPLEVSLVGVDMSRCEALCEAEPGCPSSVPVPGQSCDASLSCYYGEPYVCPLEPGTTTFYDCSNGSWHQIEKNNCELCAESCEPPLCSMCSDAVGTESALPPEQFSFCTDTSAMLYEAFWTCACVAGNPCAAVCNPEPAGAMSLCNGASPSPECANCLINVAAPDGCQNEMSACMAD